MSNANKPTAFICYNHADKEWLERLQKHLKPLVKSGTISVWSDQQIAVGAAWRAQIEENLSKANVAVFLISPDFLASDFIQDVEIPVLLRRLSTHGLKVISLIIRPCLFEDSPLAQFQALNDPNQTAVETHHAVQDRLLMATAKEIKIFSQSRIGGEAQGNRQPLLRMPLLPAEISASLGENLIENKIVYAADLGRPDPIPSPKKEPSIISGVTFKNCSLVGPAHVAVQSGSFIGCGFGLGGSPEQTFRAVAEGEPVFGAIGFHLCNFYECDFENLVFWGSKMLVDEFLKSAIQKETERKV